VGDFGEDTAVSQVDDHRYRATLSPDWDIWGPCGGYVAAVGLRAAGAATTFRRPASFACHYLGVARFEEVELEVRSLRAGRRSESLRISMTQGDRAIAELLVWATDDQAEGVELDWTGDSDRPAPGDSPMIQELVPDWAPWYPFWKNFEYRPIDWVAEEDWEAGRPYEPRYQSWFRYLPTSVFEDPWTEAGRVSLLADIAFWPAVSRAIPADQGHWIAPSLDLAVTLHQLPGESEYLWLDANVPVATNSLGGGTGQVWSEDGRLLASATQQLLFRPIDPSQLPGA
jgi:acyl-CoA thioesterase-2